LDKGRFISFFAGSPDTIAVKHGTEWNGDRQTTNRFVLL